jgi:aminodeoxyfutalosine synthase
MDLTQKLQDGTFPIAMQNIYAKVVNGDRITADEAVVLYTQADLGFLGILANHINMQKNGDTVFFNQNFHIEPTNICVYNCTFCSYRRVANEEGSWEFGLNDIVHMIQPFKSKPVTEVHITGGVHPKWDINFYGQILATIRKELPNIHIKAFSAIELDYIFRKANVSPKEGLQKLKALGLNSIPGGGAEIANSEIRENICGEKTSWSRWLEIHEAAHNEGMPSNATMLYGHIENYQHRVEHMESLRSLQDRTGGFNCFIPLKFKASNNSISYIGEVNSIEDLKNFAISRIFLDNFKHIKAYWPMLGKETTQLALNFGVNDIDGTIDDSTKIYSMAGAEDQKPSMTVEEITQLIRKAKKEPVERDSNYNPIKSY